jgi:PilZ domain
MSPACPAGDRLVLSGYTRDLSEGGLTFVAPSFDCEHVGVFYEGREVDVSISLPRSSVAARAVAVRTAPLGGREPGGGCVIALTITAIGEDDRRRYSEFLSQAAND